MCADVDKCVTGVEKRAIEMLQLDDTGFGLKELVSSLVLELSQQGSQGIAVHGAGTATSYTTCGC